MQDYGQATAVVFGKATERVIDTTFVVTAGKHAQHVE